MKLLNVIKMKNVFSIAILVLLGISTIITSCSQGKTFKEVEKPDVSNIPLLTPRQINKVPEGFKNLAFEDNSPVLMAKEDEKERGFILFSRPIVQPVYKKYHPRDNERITELTTFATKGEFEPLTFSIHPLRDMKNFRVMFSDLKSDNSVIGQENIDARLVTNWNMRYPRYTSADTYREVPELLEKVTVNSFKKGDNQRYWITVEVPKDATPGIYTGSVKLFDDVVDNAISIPVKFRVLPYELKKDPNKHFSSYHLPYSQLYFVYKTEELKKKAMITEFENMFKYGFDIFPDFYLRSRHIKGDEFELYVRPGDEIMINKAIELGFKNKITLVGGYGAFSRYYAPNAKKIGKHGFMSYYPDENSGVFNAIEKATKKFIQKCKDKGWPDIVFFIEDEPSTEPANANYVAKTYAAVKKAGGITMVSLDPTDRSSAIYHKLNCVDIWCSQPYAIPYDKVVADKTHHYWSYPNHNAGEIKIREVMQKGGRVTYGYGLWRSGYNTLFPWAWRWFPASGKNTDQFDYFHFKASGTGNRLDEDANFIPAIYWECFREGIDDGRYLYTLQQAMYERENSNDSDCKELVAEGQELLNSLWRSVEPKLKYRYVEFFSDDEFRNLRWEIASLTMKLMQYDGDDSVGDAPSVMADVSQKSIEKDDAYFIRSGIENKSITYFDMTTDNFKNWEVSKDKELEVSFNNKHEGVNIMDMEIHVDKKHDGLYDNKYPIGWPMVSFNVEKQNEKLLDYDYFTCKIKFESSRNDIDNDITKLRFVFRKPDGKGEYNIERDLGGNEGLWHSVHIPLDKTEMEGATEVIILPYEGFYPDKSDMRFEVSDIGLVKFDIPLIKRIDIPSVLLTTDRKLKVGISGFAFAQGAEKGCAFELKLRSKAGDVVSSTKDEMREDFVTVMNLDGLDEGKHILEVKIIDSKGEQLAVETVDINVIEGFVK